MKTIKKLRNSLFKLLHKGDKYTCMYCERTFNKFLHQGVKSGVFSTYKVAGGGYKENVRCPHCGSAPRSRLLGLFFKHRTEAFNQKTDILHISPNHHVADFLRKSPQVDHVVGALEIEAFPQYDPIKVDIQNIELKENVFDAAICCHVLEHVDDDMKAMRELHRILKPGGFAILQVPLALNLPQTLEDSSITTEKERKIAFGQVDHVRLYGLDYFERLKKAGFRVVRDNPFDNQWFSDEELDRHRLDPIEDVIIAFKD